jgi:OOP family OmpA-OmpF porin
MLKRLPLVVLVLLIGMSTAAHAEFYLGAAYMNTSAEVQASEKFSTDEGGWKFLAGYNFLKFLGVEAAYRDMGSLSDSENGVQFDADLKSVDVSARGILPLGIFRPFVKAGYANLDTEFSIDDVKDSDTNWELLYGIGLDLNISKISLRAEYERFDVDDDLDTISLGAYFRF